MFCLVFFFWGGDTRSQTKQYRGQQVEANPRTGTKQTKTKKKKPHSDNPFRSKSTWHAPVVWRVREWSVNAAALREIDVALEHAHLHAHSARHNVRVLEFPQAKREDFCRAVAKGSCVHKGGRWDDAHAEEAVPPPFFKLFGVKHKDLQAA